ncbi:D-alanyl-D-alanine carboxypeptidase family protein [Acinetobacter larvae]|uniref:D-alanyl-D-alanine carboxypeptidase n=1 Tax=Acinetobacter larvae TaxID=1789224 RepID=A0A1B2LYV0_9GAMM|nr:D-alanyl-D-alanine carboxypeptidase family protein [Acinetobacter larvae]AOA58069.1 D-alanyl-D-alanine carboxypeptidase [Acinetobacter larvae]
MRSITTFFAFISLFWASCLHASLLHIAPSSVEAEAWTILDSQSGQIIASHNSEQQRAPASLTKMMVAYISLKEIQAGRLKKEEIIRATPVVNMVQPDESQMYLKVGEQISVDQLLAGLIVMSANDAAVTLAERISGNVPAFVQRMNQEAQALGMHNTHFTNPAGITMPAHYSSAHDMALLGQKLTQQTPDYLSYSIQPDFRYKEHFHHATNLALKTDPSVDGLKTGYTQAAGYNLALTAHRPSGLPNQPDRRIIVVVMGTKSAVKRSQIAEQLLNLAYVYSRNEIAIQEKQQLAELPVIRSTLKIFKIQSPQPHIVTTSLYNHSNPILLTQFDPTRQLLVIQDQQHQPQIIAPAQNTQTHFDVELTQKSLTAPLAGPMELAKVHVYQNQQLLQTFNIQDNVILEQAHWWQRLWMWLIGLFA